MNASEIIKDIAKVINRHSLENESDTPDYILAEVAYDAIAAYNKAVNSRGRFRSEQPLFPKAPVEEPLVQTPQGKYLDPYPYENINSPEMPRASQPVHSYAWAPRENFEQDQLYYLGRRVGPGLYESEKEG